MPPVPPPGPPPSPFPVAPALPVPPGPGNIGLGIGGTGAGKPGFPGAGNGAGTAAGTGISTAPAFTAVNAMKEDPIAQIAMTPMSVCILSSLSKSHAYYVTGTITRKARNASSNLMVKAHHLGWKSPSFSLPSGVIAVTDPKSHRASHELAPPVHLGRPCSNFELRHPKSNGVRHEVVAMASGIDLLDTLAVSLQP